MERGITPTMRALSNTNEDADFAGRLLSIALEKGKMVETPLCFLTTREKPRLTKI